MMNYKNLTRSAGIALLAAGAVTAKSSSRPNVLLIITDDQNPATVGCYGGSVQTPWIDSLATNGIRFANANVVHTICSPSRYAILTGRYYDNSTAGEFYETYPTGTASCVNNFIELEDDGMNLPSVLQANGYTTGYVGKFHLADCFLLPSTNLWPEYGLHTYGKDLDPRKDAGLNATLKANHERWVKRVKQFGFDWADAIYPANLRESFNGFLNAHNVEWTTDAAIRFLKEQKGKERPFFLCMATTYDHGPRPHRKRNGRYMFSLDKDVQLTGEGLVTDRDLSGVLKDETRESCKRLEGQPGLDEIAPTALWWDAAVGAVLDALRDNGQYENTLVIYISDHGQFNGGKSTLYESGSHVPLLMQWPARVGGGRTYDHVVGSIDLTPTVLDACDVLLPDGYTMNGISLLPVLNGTNLPVRDSLFLEMGYAHGIKTDHWKYIAVRYSAEIEKMIAAGEQDAALRAPSNSGPLPPWRGPGDKTPNPQPYLILHGPLAKKSAEHNPNYFARNQLYNLQTDPDEQENLFVGMPEKSAEMKAFLDQAMSRNLPQRPFGEFGALKNPELFAPVSDAVWVPARD